MKHIDLVNLLFYMIIVFGAGVFVLKIKSWRYWIGMLIMFIGMISYHEYNLYKYKKEYEVVSMEGMVRGIDLSQFKEGQLLAVGDSGGLVLATHQMNHDRIIGMVTNANLYLGDIFEYGDLFVFNATIPKDKFEVNDTAFFIVKNDSIITAGNNKGWYIRRHNFR